MAVVVPRRIAEELQKRGIDAESLTIDYLARLLQLDPEATAQFHLELALRYLEEGKRLIEKDPAQSSEKLYKAAEESVKALETYLNLKEILEDVEKNGRWSIARLEKAVSKNFTETRIPVQVMVGHRMGITRLGLPRGKT